jgi:hypothetical protein
MLVHTCLQNLVQNISACATDKIMEYSLLRLSQFVVFVQDEYDLIFFIKSCKRTFHVLMKINENFQLFSRNL